MKKVISYSLYGSNPFYTHGALVNAMQAPKFYPGWITRFYIGDSVPNDVVQKLVLLKAEIIPMQEVENKFANMMWRFMVFEDQDVEIALLRDTDSRFSIREVTAVEDWLKTGKNFHIMRDHPFHDMPIMGGMWGGRCVKLRHIKKLIKESPQKNCYGADQFFLREKLYPCLQKDVCVHASFWAYEKEAKPFPTQRMNNEFVGERIDEHEQPCIIDRAIIEKYENSLIHKMLLQTKFHIKKKILQLRNLHASN